MHVFYLQMILQMIRRSGTVAVDGQLCYVPQQAWILNATLRENILFGIPFDKEKQVLYYLLNNSFLLLYIV
jgi:ABC-type multidrug transport system fused ATPase/permease subunit